MWTATAFLNPQRRRNSRRRKLLRASSPITPAGRTRGQIEPLLLPDRQWFFATREKWDLPILDEIERQTINCLAEDTANASAMEQMKVEFERQSGTAVDFDKYPLEGLKQIAKSEILWKRTLFYDIMCLHNEWLSSLVLYQQVLRIEDFATLHLHPDFEAWRGFESEHLPQRLVRGRLLPRPRPAQRPHRGGRVRRVPVFANTMLLVYDRTLLEDDRSRSAYHDATART